MKTAEEIVRDKGQELIAVSSNATIFDALQVMLRHRIGAIFIKEAASYVGVWTERDLIKNVTTPGFDPKTALVRDYMNTDLQTAPHTDTTYSLMEKFRKLRIRHILVEKFGAIIGLVTPGDVMVEKNKEIESLNRELESKIGELNTVNRQLSLSEEKYRMLVEGSNDYLFSLDEKWNFITANRALTDYFKISVDDIASRNFLDIIYAAGGETSVTKQLVKRKLLEFAAHKKPVQFYAEFKSPRIIEPRQFIIRLEYVNVPGKNEILGKATDVLEDQLLEYLELERKHFAISNSLLTTDDISRRITRALNKFIDRKDIDILRIAVREMIINAIEHGNLKISFDEKSRALASEEYFKLLRARAADPSCRNKKVHIEYLIDGTRAMYKITDDGDGFDHEAYMQNILETLNGSELEHGRGIAMALGIFDEVKYNKKGNQVLLVKNLSGLTS